MAIISTYFVARARQRGIIKTRPQVVRILILNLFANKLTVINTRQAPDFMGAHAAEQPSGSSPWTDSSRRKRPL